MPFELRIEFSGLCLYVVHPDGDRVAVAMPDGRKWKDPKHVDGTIGEPHAGYVRFDLANVGSNASAGVALRDAAGNPSYEVVHRFDSEVLDLGAELTPAPMTIDLPYPDFKQIGPTLDLVGGLFGPTPPPHVLMRMELRGGQMGSVSEGKTWRFSTALNPGGAPHTGQFSSLATWMRPVDANQLTLTFTSFDGSRTTVVPLTPSVGPDGKSAITLKVANLCLKNPLEWEDLRLRTIKGDDEDFKWIYRLLQPSGSTYEALLGGATLPIPQLVGAQPQGIHQDCGGGKITAAF